MPFHDPSFMVFTLSFPPMSLLYAVMPAPRRPLDYRIVFLATQADRCLLIYF